MTNKSNCVVVSPIRVLNVVTQMNRAGLESRLMDIYRNIDRSRIQFDFLTFRTEPGYYDSEIFTLGGRVFYTAPITFTNVYKIPKYMRFFLSEHPEYRIVHAHVNQMCGVILKAAMQKRVPVRIAHSHTALGKVSINNFLKNMIKLTTNLYATHRFAVSQEAAKWLFGKRAVNNGITSVLPNSIDCRKFKYNSNTREKIRKKLKLDNFTIIIHVGNLRKEKNHTFLIDIFDQLKKELMDVKLLIIGADFLDGKIHDYASSKESSKDIYFLGARSDIDVLLQAGDVFVFPSLYEGFPGAVLEAQAASLPCIISDTITSEVCLTEHIVQLPLNKGVDLWVNQIMSFTNVQRTDNYYILHAKGYDIFDLSDRLMNFYENTLCN